MLLSSPGDGMGHGMALAFHVAIFRLPVTGSYTTTIGTLRQISQLVSSENASAWAG